VRTRNVDIEGFDHHRGRRWGGLANDDDSA